MQGWNAMTRPSTRSLATKGSAKALRPVPSRSSLRRRAPTVRAELIDSAKTGKSEKTESDLPLVIVPPLANPLAQKADCTGLIEKAPPPKAEISPEDQLRALNEQLARARAAQEKYATYSQEQVDEIFKAAALAANSKRIELAKMAVEETGMGVMEDKVIKNHFASEMIYNKYKNLKTCGVIEVDEDAGVQKVAEPVGVVAGIVPTTNPTSTAIFKALICLKTRNALVISPHPRAAKATIAAAKTILDAAVGAGAPADIISWIATPTTALSAALMQSPSIDMILATGGPAMVKAAYASGHPALGVGAGNTPAVIDDTCHMQMAVSSVIISKTFDNGVICASEQSVIVLDSIYDKVRSEFLKRSAYILNAEEKKKVAEKILINGRLNANIVGQSVQKLAGIFGITVPKSARLIIGEVDTIGPEEPFSFEKLCPVLAMYRAKDYDEAVAMAHKLVTFGGPGHTAVLYTNPANKEHIRKFEDIVKTVRILINTPASQGAIGDLYNFQLDPSLTLGCGSWGSTSVSANVGPTNLLNIKTVSERRENMLWFRVPPKVYFKGGALRVALQELKGYKRAFVVTDKPLFDMGFGDKVTDVLDGIKVSSEVFHDVEPDPTLATVQRGLDLINKFQPDVIIAIGGGSPMDAAKVMWLMYEHPDTKFDGLSTRFMDIRKRVYELGKMGTKAQFIAIPTTSGTGSEVTPFSVVTDQVSGIKYPLADYALTPTMAIVDPQLVMGIPKKLTAWGGIDALTHAIESFVSVCATEYTRGLSLEAIRILFKYLPRAYKNGASDPKAREKVHYASTIAGMAFANAFLGICHSMAHKLGSTFHVPHGLANAMLISHVIRYNATDAPFKQAIFSQYKYPNMMWAYSIIADRVGITTGTDEEKVLELIRRVEELKREVEIPTTIKEYLGAEREQEFIAKLDMMAEQAFDDQCTGANPRYPLVADLRELMWDAWSSPILPIDKLDKSSQ